MSDVEATMRRQTYRYLTGGTLRHPDGRSVVIGAQPVTVGRAPSADLLIDDPAVSALHCELRGTAKGVVLRDLDSTNGTMVGDVAVGEALLTGRCAIRVGATELELQPADGPARMEDAPLAPSFGPLIGGSALMRQLYQTLASVAPTELSVLITGETGTGKELVAQAIHQASRRSAGPFVVVDAGALPSGLAESLLFGHEKGAFTGAAARSAGAFLQANGGTLFIDELGELPEVTQPKLLRAIAERAVKRVGGSKYEPLDVRVVAATRRDLRRAINGGSFRDDLYFRVAQVRIELPPLRDRVDDIAPLVADVCRRLGRPDAAAQVTAYVQQRFKRYDWPGNVRELVSVASALAALMDSGVEGIDEMLPVEHSRLRAEEAAPTSHFAQAKREFEAGYFGRLFAEAAGNISEIARRSGLARHQVRAYLKKHGLVA